MAELATLMQREKAAIPKDALTLVTVNGDFLSASLAGEHYKGYYPPILLD
jgi:hypothetical protein